VTTVWLVVAVGPRRHRRASCGMDRFGRSAFVGFSLAERARVRRGLRSRLGGTTWGWVARHGAGWHDMGLGGTRLEEFEIFASKLIKAMSS
jgi:hypothetical protein